MKIIIEKQRVYAYHGVLPQERQTGAFFEVSIILEVDKNKALQSDELQDTISYADIASCICQEMAIPSKLLEHVAWRIATRLETKYPQIKNTTIRLMKENPPMSIECQGAGIEVSTKEI